MLVFLCSRFEADLYTSCMLGGLCPLIYLCYLSKKKTSLLSVELNIMHLC